MKLNIAVLFGGASVEHEISIISANQVLNALDSNKYNIIPVYISKEKDFYFSNSYFDLKNFKKLDKAILAGTKVLFRKNCSKVEMINFKSKLFNNKMMDIDIFFPVTHGTSVEDGQLQGYLETLDATYVGSETKAAVNGQDKVFMKAILKENGIQVVDYTWGFDRDYFEDEKTFIEKIEKKLIYPVIVKPANLGSSIGINKADSYNKLKDALETAFKYDSKVLIEKVVENMKEVNCAVLGDYTQQTTSAIEEVFQSDEILSYEDKYTSKNGKSQGMANTKRIIPAELDLDLTKRIEEMAIKAFKVLNLNGDVRIDFLIDKNTNEVYLNETNTIPGSLAFYLWEYKDINFRQLCDELIKLAIKKKRENKQLLNTFTTNVLENYNGTKAGKLK